LFAVGAGVGFACVVALLVALGVDSGGSIRLPRPGATDRGTALAVTAPTSATTEPGASGTSAAPVGTDPASALTSPARGASSTRAAGGVESSQPLAPIAHQPSPSATRTSSSGSATATPTTSPAGGFVTQGAPCPRLGQRGVTANGVAEICWPAGLGLGLRWRPVGLLPGP
jgi:hypothetical protein